jgi:hypothetical protein
MVHGHDILSGDGKGSPLLRNDIVRLKSESRMRQGHCSLGFPVEGAYNYLNG